MPTDALPPSLTGRRIVVTGASGFLGSQLCDRLLSGGAAVYGTSRIARPPATNGLQWRQATLHHPLDATRLLGEIAPEIVIHLSGHVTANPSVTAVPPTFQSLLADTVNLLTGIVDCGCRRVVLVGSLTEPEGGGEAIVPGSPYVAAKWAASGYGRMFHALYQAPVIIARPSMTYGPGQDQHKLIPYVIRCLLQGEPPRLTDGKLLADWTYIDDMVDGLVHAALVSDIEGETVDLGTGTLTSVRSVVQEIVQLLDSPVAPQWGALPDRPREFVRAADAARTEGILRWKASTSLTSGLEKTIEALRESCR